MKARQLNKGNAMYYAVKVDAGRNVLESMTEAFATPKACLNAARAKWGKAGGMQFARSRLVLL